MPLLSVPAAPEGETILLAGKVCPRCGGSGTLLQGNRSHRTCLECLGQGRLGTGGNECLPFARLSVSASASASR